jgi:23S rRNA (cytosine1962-C5)-methyltransferase
MAVPDDYELVDAGDGRRLERFGERLVDRPAPGATGPPGLAAAWRDADLRFDRHAGWTGPVEPWQVAVDGLTLELRPTEAGQVGLFPEHRVFWPAFRGALGDRPGAEVLNLFAATGAPTLALVTEGARVTHVDAARSAVAWARRNAELSGLGDRPVRWIVDEAAAYVARERRRDRRYRAVLLDPPSYGHGAGRAWRLDDDLPDLLAACASLVEPGGWLLVTVHTTGWDADRLAATVDDVVGTRASVGEIEAGDLVLGARSGTSLALGSFARVIIAR